METFKFSLLEMEAYLLTKDFYHPALFTKKVIEIIKQVINRNDYIVIGKHAGNKKPRTVEAVMMGQRKNDIVLSIAYDVAVFKLNKMLEVLKDAEKNISKLSK